MTRSKEYDFTPPNLPLFADDRQREITLRNGERVSLHSAWRTIIMDNPRGGEGEAPGKFYSYFQDYKLEFRRLVRDDDFANVWYYLVVLLASVSKNDGLTGYFLVYESNLQSGLTLIHFKDGLVYECPVRALPESEKNSVAVDAEVLPLQGYREECSQLVLQELSLESQKVGLTLDSFINSSVFHKELIVPEEVQRQWAWKSSKI